MRQDRATLLKEARILSDRGKLNQADERKFQALMSEAASLKTQIEQLESRGGAPPSGDVDGGHRETREQEQHALAFSSYIRNGINGMPEEQRALLQQYRAERRDMGIDGGNSVTGPRGSFLVPIGFVDRIEAALKFSGNLLRDCTIMPTVTGQPMPYPMSDDTQILGELIGENTQVTTQDVSLSNVVFGAYKFSSRLVKASLELVEDSAFDLETWLSGVLGTRLSRVLNNYLTTGTGVNQPRGIITAALAAGNIVAGVGAAGNDGVSLGNSIGTTDIQNLVHAVDPLYREDESCRLMMHDQTRKRLAQQLDKYGRPIFPYSPVQGATDDFIMGYKVSLNNAMDQLQVSPTSPPVTRNVMVFGPLKKYVARRVKDMSMLVLRERFIDYGQLGYLIFTRWDGNLLNAASESAQSPIALLQTNF